MWSRGDAEMAIAVKRAELNRALNYKRKYNAESHNICLALLRFDDGTTDVLPAYSNDSAIPQSIRLGLNLIPDVYGALPRGRRFGCDGMAQYHTEPKLLNYLSATPEIRRRAFRGFLPRDPFYRSVLQGQREQAAKRAELLKNAEELSCIALVTEIDCCPTCLEYSIKRFCARFPHTPLYPIELGKKTREKIPPRFEEVKVSVRRR